jgi:hypothetical protein
MMRVFTGTVCIVLSMAVAATHADTVVLRNGKKIHGTLLGANARQIEFLPESGKAQAMPITEIEGISFSTPAVLASGGSGTAKVDRAARPALVIPAGSTIRVRTEDNIDVDSTQAGARFRGSLDDPIMIGGSVVVPRGAEVTLQATKVQQSGKMKGSDLIELKLNQVVINGKSYPLVTTFQQVAGGSEGRRTARKVFGGAGLGAIVGGIAGGGTGAAIGAAVGGAGGAIISGAGEQHLKVPAETRLEFRLEAAVKI